MLITFLAQSAAILLQLHIETAFLPFILSAVLSGEMEVLVASKGTYSVDFFFFYTVFYIALNLKNKYHL